MIERWSDVHLEVCLSFEGFVTHTADVAAFFAVCYPPVAAQHGR